MFASIKKRIAAETGKDVSELMPYLTERLSGSRQSSITSLTSSTHDEVGTSKADGNHNEQSKKQQKLSDAEKLEISNLKETIKFLENQNQKLLNHQESLDQLDVLQSQELSKIKHLLLLKDQEVQQLNLQISNNNKIIEELTEENHKLKDKEHQFHNIQEIKDQQLKELSDWKHYEHISKNDQTDLDLLLSESSNENELQKVRIHDLELELANSQTSNNVLNTLLLGERNLKELVLMKFPEWTEILSIIKKNLQQIRLDFEVQFANLKNDLENELRVLVNNYEQKITTLLDNKDMIIKRLDKEINDQKSSYAKSELTSDSVAPVPHEDQLSSLCTPLNKQFIQNDSDVTFQYLRHIVIKFITSSDHEAKYLIKALSASLKLSKDEEKQLKRALETKNSWFPSSSRFNFKSGT